MLLSISGLFAVVAVVGAFWPRPEAKTRKPGDKETRRSG
jgi:hypothetical protein